MNRFRTIVLPALLLAFAGLLHAAESAGGDGPEPDPAKDERLKESQQLTTGAVTIGGQRVEYRAVAGLLQVDDRKDEPSAVMSYVAYFGNRAAGAPARPVIFLYNGGPGSSTIWLHMGAFGPRRVLTGNGHPIGAAPYRVVDNEFSLLDAADLVFIDAPGTGFGRIVAVDRSKAKEREKLKEKEKEFWGVDQDAAAFARFIRKFLSRHALWNAPKYLFGESYGTTRSAVLARLLQEQEGIDLNGVILLSQVLDFGNSADDPLSAPGDERPFALALPTFAATAWYHDRLPQWADRSPATRDRLVAEARDFAMRELLPALQSGRALDPAVRRELAAKMSGYTGLPAAYLEKAGLRVSGGMFGQQLLAAEGATVGRFDARYRGPSIDPLAKEWTYDPQSAAIGPAYIAAYNDYARNTLKFGPEAVYRADIEIDQGWDFKHKPPGADQPRSGTVNVLPDLATAMITNPRLRVQMHAGLYDLATPFAAAEYELQHLPIPDALRANITVHRYPAGHMMYDDPASLKALHDDVARFVAR